MKAFLDTNILIYAYSTDVKRSRALAVVAAGGVISTQVLNEFTNVLRNKQRQEWPIIEDVIRSVHFSFLTLCRSQPAPMQPPSRLRAIIDLPSTTR